MKNGLTTSFPFFLNAKIGVGRTTLNREKKEERGWPNEKLFSLEYYKGKVTPRLHGPHPKKNIRVSTIFVFSS